MFRGRGILVISFLSSLAVSNGETFVKHSEWFQVGPEPCAIAAEDLNGDGIPEIVTADRGTMTDTREERPANDELSLLESTGELTFAAKPPLRAGFAPWCIAVANIDALKAPDVVVGSFHDARRRHLTLFRNLGENGFEPHTFAVQEIGLEYKRILDADDRPVFTQPGITSLVVRDFNGDGFRDAIATGWSSDVLLYFPGDRDAYFGQARLIQAPGGPRDIQVADLDGDDHLDLVTSMYSSGEVVLWRGDGSAGFTEVQRFESRGTLPHKVRLADFNRDGKFDIAVSHCYASDNIVLFFGEGDLRFSLSQDIDADRDNNRQVVEQEIRDIVVGDFNRDGRPDLAATCFASRKVLVLINRLSEGSVVPVFERETYAYKDARPYALCVADFNQDDRLDIGVTLWEVNRVGLLLSQ